MEATYASMHAGLLVKQIQRPHLSRAQLDELRKLFS